MIRLATRAVAKPWGRTTLPAPFVAPAGERIGEIWFEPPAACPDVLIKYIFTSEKLSVQVHPDDAQAAGAGLGSAGKEECWLVIAAEPGANLGVGFNHAVDPATLRAAALDGSIEQLMTWYPVAPGDFFFIPAGTVHAIGAGVSLIEIQQNTDITWRLYDYGRPRELHLDAGIAVTRGVPHDPALRRHVPATGTVELVEAAHFRAHRIDGLPDADLAARYAGPVLVLPRTGVVSIGGEELEPGTCGLAQGLGAVRFAADGQAIVVAAG